MKGISGFDAFRSNIWKGEEGRRLSTAIAKEQSIRASADD